MSTSPAPRWPSSSTSPPRSGIFSFLINYMTAEPPSLPSVVADAGAPAIGSRSGPPSPARTSRTSRPWRRSWTPKPIPCPPSSPPSSLRSTLQHLAQLKEGTASETTARVAMMQDLNSLILKTNIYSPDRFSGITLQEPTKQLLAQDAKTRNEPRLNRLLLADAYPEGTRLPGRIRGIYQPVCRDAGIVWFLLLPAGPGLRRRLAGALLRAQGRGLVFRVECGALRPGLPQAGLALGGMRLPELLLHVHHVPDHLRPGHLRAGRPRERRLVLSSSWASSAAPCCPR